MNNRLLKTVLGIALGLSAAAVPGYCSAFLAFSASAGTPGGSVVITGDSSSETLTSLSGVLYNTLGITNAPDAADNGTWTITNSNLSYNTTSKTFSLVGDLSSCNGCVGTPNLTGQNLTLEAFTVSSMSYNTGANSTTSGFNTTLAGQTSLSLFFGAPTSFNEMVSGGNGTFLSDLGLAGATSSLTSGGVASSSPASNASGVYTFTPTSETLNVTLNAAAATPEPVSFVLFGSGLLGLAWFARRRSAQN